MWDERRAIAVLMSVCAAELDGQLSDRPIGAAFDDRHVRLLHGIARELDSLAEVLNIPPRSTPKPVRHGLLTTYRRVLDLPLARTVRSVLTAQLARLERAPVEESQLDAA